MLSREQIDFYHDQGYLHVTGVFTTDEIDVLEEAFDGVIARRLAKRAALNTVWNGDWNKNPGSTLIHTHDVQAYSAAWARALVHPRFTEMLADLIGPNVQLHHTKLFQKPTENGAGFPTHQDYPYFPHEKHTMAAAVIHLSDADESMGCLRVGPASHKLGPLPTVDGKGSFYVDQDRYPLESLTPVPAACGDVVIFNYLTLHGSGLNTSDRTRKTVLVQFRDPADKPTEDTHRSHAQGLMLHGVDPLEDRPHAIGVMDEGRVAAPK